MSTTTSSNEPSPSGTSEQLLHSDSASPTAANNEKKCLTAVSTKGSSTGVTESHLTSSAPLDSMSPKTSDDCCSSAATSQLPKNAGDMSAFQGGLLDRKKMEQKESNIVEVEQKRRSVDGPTGNIELSVSPLSSRDAKIMKNRSATHSNTISNHPNGSSESKEGLQRKRRVSVLERTPCNDEIEENKINGDEKEHFPPDSLSRRSIRPRSKDSLQGSLPKNATLGQKPHAPSIVVNKSFSSSQNADDVNSCPDVQQVLSGKFSPHASRRSKEYLPIPHEVCGEAEDYDNSLVLLQHTEEDGIIAISSSPLALPKPKVTGQLPVHLSPLPPLRNDGVVPTFEERCFPFHQQNEDAGTMNADFPPSIALQSLINDSAEEGVEGETENRIPSAAENADTDAAMSSSAEGQLNASIPSGWGVRTSRNAETQTVGRNRSREHRRELMSLGTRGRRGQLGSQALREQRDENRTVRIKRGSLTVEQKEALRAFHAQPRRAATAPLRLLHAVILQEFLSFKHAFFSSQLFLPWQRGAYLKNHMEGEIKWGQNFWVDTVPYPVDTSYETPFHDHQHHKSSWGNLNTSVNVSKDHNGLWCSENNLSNPNPLYFSGASSSLDNSPFSETRRQECFESVEGFLDRGSVEMGDFGGNGKPHESLLVECGEREIFLPQKGKTSSIQPSKQKNSFLSSPAERRRNSHRGESLRSLSRMSAFFLNCHHLFYRCCCLRCAIAQQTSLIFLDGERQRLVPIPFVFPNLYAHPMQYSRAVFMMAGLDAVTCGFCCPCLGYNGMGTAFFGWRLRYWVRCRYGLNGTSINDLLAMLLCPALGSDQIGFELESHGIHEPWSPFVSSGLKELNSLYQIR